MVENDKEGVRESIGLRRLSHVGLRTVNGVLATTLGDWLLSDIAGGLQTQGIEYLWEGVSQNFRLPSSLEAGNIAKAAGANALAVLQSVPWALHRALDLWFMSNIITAPTVTPFISIFRRDSGPTLQTWNSTRSAELMDDTLDPDSYAATVARSDARSLYAGIETAMSQTKKKFTDLPEHEAVNDFFTIYDPVSSLTLLYLEEVLRVYYMRHDIKSPTLYNLLRKKSPDVFASKTFEEFQNSSSQQLAERRFIINWKLF